ncbi:MAG: hypothetical protein A2Z51_07045 [Deltaproteobacteria bacterium RBG_19FT_COMBO_52_11]|nr:MAG: hypothetical protein A2Z51_07045 [Deltaproteobacteria bacterium RBG_19FT_COMBO_52_11]
MDLHSFVPSCRRPFAEGRESVEGHSCPPDFGPPQADEFFRPLDNKKGFPHPDFNFFTASPIEGEGKIRVSGWELTIFLAMLFFFKATLIK